MESKNRPCFAHFPEKVAESCGTTIVALEFDGGVVIAADSRTSNGPYVTNRFTNKLTELTPYIFAGRSGLTCDTQAVTDFAKYKYETDKVAFDYPESVFRMAQIYRAWCHFYRDDMEAGIMIAGWDEVNGGQVYLIPQSGAFFHQHSAATGSGSWFNHGYLATQYKPGLTRAAAEKIAINAVAMSMAIDGGSGGLIRYGAITKNGMDQKMVLPSAIPTAEHEMSYEEI